MKYANQVRSWVALHHAMLLAGLVCLPHEAVFVLACGFFVGWMIQSNWLHRGVSHRWMKSGGIYDWIQVWVIFLIGTGSTISFTVVHRTHHAFSDTERDPHSPFFTPAWKVWLTIWPTVKAPAGVARDLMRAPAHRWMHDNYSKGMLLILLTSYAINPLVGLVVSSSCVMAFHRAGFFNTFGHTVGTKPWSPRWISNHMRHHDSPMKI